MFVSAPDHNPFMRRVNSLKMIFKMATALSLCGPQNQPRAIKISRRVLLCVHMTQNKHQSRIFTVDFDLNPALNEAAGIFRLNTCTSPAYVG
jgi:hypothetical protein